MNLNSIPVLILLIFGVLCSDLLTPRHSKALTQQSKARSGRRQPKPPDVARLIQDLRAHGAAVTLSKERISQPFFAAQGRVIHVTQQAVWVFSYANAAAFERDVAKISSDGMTIGHSKPSWMGTPHFYRQQRLIVLYLGDDSRVLDALTPVLGQQFAGG